MNTFAVFHTISDNKTDSFFQSLIRYPKILSIFSKQTENESKLPVFATSENNPGTYTDGGME